MRVTSTIDVAAPVQTVWDVLTDYQDYPTWNPFIVGATATGRRSLSLTIDVAPEERLISCDARIIRDVVPSPLEIRLEIAPGFVHGRYVAHLETHGGGVTLRQDIRFGGLVHKLYVHRPFLVVVRNGLDAMGAALKRQVEPR
jgi:hypothetical protein